MTNSNMGAFFLGHPVYISSWISPNGFYVKILEWYILPLPDTFIVREENVRHQQSELCAPSISLLSLII